MLWSSLKDGGFYPFELRAAKGELLLLSGRWDELDEIYRRDLEAAQRSQTGYYIRYYMMKKAELLVRRQMYPEARDLLKKVDEMTEEAGEQDLRERARDLMVGVCIFLEDYVRAEAILDQFIETARSRGNQPAVGWFLNYRAAIMMNKGETVRALEIMGERLAIARRYGGHRDIAQGCISIGGIWANMGRYGRSLRYSRLSAAISRKIGDKYLLYYAIYNMATACEGLGRRRDALRYFGEDLEMARQLGDGPGAEQILGDITRVEESAADSLTCPDGR